MRPPTRRLMATAAAIALAGAALTGIMGGDAGAATPLVRGWNNVPYLGSPGAPADALSTIAGQYSAVYRWDATNQHYDLYAPGLPSYTNTLTTLNTGDAIWVDLTGESGTLPGSVSSGGGGTAGPRHLSVAASTFLPVSDLAIYQKTFNELAPVGTDEASKRYFAPVYLPDGVTITSMTAAFEASGGDVQVRLDYTPLANGSDTGQVYKLVEVLSASGGSPQTAQAFSHTVDNAANVYFLVVDLTGGPGTKLHGVSIAYTG